jgi:LEA14-like dessication related protein
MAMRKTFLFLAFSSLFIISCNLINQVQSRIPQPGFQLQSIRINKVDLSAMTLLMVSSVKNPYSVELPSSILNLDLFIEGTKLSQIKTDLGTIKAKSTQELPLEIRLPYSDLLKFYRNFPNQEALNLKFQGDMELPIPAQFQLGGQKSIKVPVAHTQEIPTFNPDLRVENFQVALPSLSQMAAEAGSGILAGIFGNGGSNPEAQSIGTEFDLRVLNQSKAKFLIQKLNFDMDLDGLKFLKIAPKEIIPLENANLVRVKANIPVTSATSGLVNLLRTKKANYKLTGNSNLGFPSLGPDQPPFLFEKNGNLTWK